MMNRLYIAISFLFLSVTAFAQRTEKVETEYIYHAPENISLEEAKQTALERAKIEALKTAFGESVDRITNTLIENEGTNHHHCENQSEHISILFHFSKPLQQIQSNHWLSLESVL